MRVNGWQRVGIVLSVLWAIGAAIFVRNAQVQNADSLYKMQWMLQPIGQMSHFYQ